MPPDVVVVLALVSSVARDPADAATRNRRRERGFAGDRRTAVLPLRVPVSGEPCVAWLRQQHEAPSALDLRSFPGSSSVGGKGEWGEMRVQVELTLPRDAVSVPFARHVVSAALHRAGVTSDCLAEVAVAVSEACTNAFHHSSADGSYEVVMSIAEEELIIDVIDSGAGFGISPTPAAMPHVSAENGRGMALMSAYTDSAAFDSVVNGGGSVHLVKRLRWYPGAPLRRAAVTSA